MLWQTEKVEEVVGALPIRGALCFIDAEWPLFADPFTVDDVLITWPRNLVKQILADGDGAVGVTGVAARLSSTLRTRA